MRFWAVRFPQNSRHQGGQVRSTAFRTKSRRLADSGVRRIHAAAPFGAGRFRCLFTRNTKETDDVTDEFFIQVFLFFRFVKSAGSFGRVFLNLGGLIFIGFRQFETPGNKKRSDSLACEQRSRSGVVDQGGCQKKLLTPGLQNSVVHASSP